MNVNLLRIVLTGGLLMGAAARVEVQSASTLAVVTVPDDRLPPGCRLKPTEPKPLVDPQRDVVVIAGDSGLSAATNPWSGSDRRLAAAIRQRVDGTPPQPDGPPLNGRASAAFALKWADNVVEAYRDTYRSANESLIEVFAVRFDHQALALTRPPAGTRNVPRGVTSRVVRGPAVVLISTDANNSCFQAISDYVESLR